MKIKMIILTAMLATIPYAANAEESFTEETNKPKRFEFKAQVLNLPRGELKVGSDILVYKNISFDIDLLLLLKSYSFSGSAAGASTQSSSIEIQNRGFGMLKFQDKGYAIDGRVRYYLGAAQKSGIFVEGGLYLEAGENSKLCEAFIKEPAKEADDSKKSDNPIAEKETIYNFFANLAIGYKYQINDWFALSSSVSKPIWIYSSKDINKNALFELNFDSLNNFKFEILTVQLGII